MTQAPKSETQTIEITNFGGRLTRILNGDLNSGFAKFANSFGYDPFSKPMNLTWLEILNDVNGINDLVLDGKMAFGIDGDANPNAYLISSLGKLYKVQVLNNANNSVNSVVGIGSVLAGSPTYNKGASMEFFGSNTKIYIGSDNGINSINFNGSADVVVGGSGFAANVYRPLADFAGSLIFGNGPTIGEVSQTGTVTSSIVGISSTIGNIYTALLPALPVTQKVHDLDTSPDNNYLLISASEGDFETIANQIQTPNLVNTFPGKSKVFYWNGSDPTVTAGTTLANNLMSALQSYLQQTYIFASDSFGSGVYSNDKKIVTLPFTKSPFPNATGVNGQFLFWTAPEKFISAGVTRLLGTMYYFGSLDQENPPGLFRMFYLTPSLVNGNVIEMPFNKVVSTSYLDTNTTTSSVVTAGIGTHYISYLGVSSPTIGASSVMGLKRFNVPATGNGIPQNGVYETQNQLFSKRIGISQIRVYTEPTIANNAFQLDIIGGDGNVVDNGTFTYSFGSIVDPNTNSSVMERINFNPDTKTLFSVGLRITNIGISNMTIKKIEVDYTPEGK